SVGGTWNNWTPGASPMQNVALDLWALDTTLPRTSAQEYKFVDGTFWFQDYRARNVVWDGIDHQAPGEFNAVLYPELKEASKGRLVAWRAFHSSVLNDNRDVFVYLPAAYDDASCPTLPSIY